MGEGFEFGIVRGDEGGDAAFEQVREDGTRQRRTFLWIGASAEFVQDDQGAAVGLLQDVDDVGDVAGEGGEGLLDGLLVADVGVDGLEAGQLRAGLGRDVQPGLSHQRQQANGLERDGLAARVGAGDDQGVGARSEVNGDGDNSCRIQ